MNKPRDLAARGVAVDDALLRCANDRGLGFGHGGDRARTITRGDRLLNFSHCGTNARATRLIDDFAASDLARGFLGGLGIGHNVENTC